MYAPRPLPYCDISSPSIVAIDCGIKYNIIRYLARLGVKLTVVPYDYDFEANPDKVTVDGLFISNGPGNPEMATATIETLKRFINVRQLAPMYLFCFLHPVPILLPAPRILCLVAW